jgi:hypothetical protein
VVKVIGKSKSVGCPIFLSKYSGLWNVVLSVTGTSDSMIGTLIRNTTRRTALQPSLPCTRQALE